MFRRAPSPGIALGPAAAATRAPVEHQPPQPLPALQSPCHPHDIPTPPAMASWLLCCQSAVKDALKGASCLTALGGLACLLGGVRALLPLGATAADPSVAWFAWAMW